MVLLINKICSRKSRIVNMGGGLLLLDPQHIILCKEANNNNNNNNNPYNGSKTTLKNTNED